MMNTNQTTQTMELVQVKNGNALVVPSSTRALDMMRMEIAQELGITLGAETSARDNGKVGGEMTKRLVALAKEYLASQDVHDNIIH